MTRKELLAFAELTPEEWDDLKRAIEKKQARLDCDDCGRTDGTHNMEVEH